MEDRHFLDQWPRPPGVYWISPDWWRYQYGTSSDDTLRGDWSRAPTHFASKEDIGGLFIYAGDGKDTVHAGFGNDEVWGGNGDDRLFGEGGDDQLFGELGRDYLDGGQGADWMSGGEDNDNYVVDNIGDKVLESVNAGSDVVESHLFHYTLPSNVEHLFLKGSAVEGNGNELDNFIIGNDMDNRISGWDGEDDLFGGKGRDTILGGNHNDSIRGGPNADLLVGGDGADTFWWASASETGLSSSTMDVISDFTPLQGDKIDLERLATEAGVQDLSFVGFNFDNFTAPGQVGFEQDAFTLNISIWLNMDSDAQAEAGITVNYSGFTPDASWFVL
jgi:Ca2+-binding RTX toxin-like protein